MKSNKRNGGSTAGSAGKSVSPISLRPFRFRLERGGYFLVTILIGIILLLDLFFCGTEYAAKKTFGFPNAVLLLLALAAAGIYLVGRRALPALGSRQRKFFDIRIAAACLFLAELFLTWNIWFESGWDVGVILANADCIARGDTESLGNGYYSWYPNNILLTYLYSLLLRIHNTLPLFSSGVQLLILVNCLLVSAAGVLLYRCILVMGGSEGTAAAGWGIYAVLIGLSGWLVIPYSDMAALIFPVSVFLLYISHGAKLNSFLKWFLISVLSLIGYQIKPTVLIVLIAIILTEGLYFVPGRGRNRSDINILAVSGIVAAVPCFLLIVQITRMLSGFSLNPNMSIGITHFFMMGLNEATNGAYSQDDVIYSLHTATTAQRKAADILEVRKRFSEFGVGGYLRHLWKKALVNFSDGSFAWGQEGNFYAYVPEAGDHPVTVFLRELYYSDGKYNLILRTVEQFFWLLTLLGTGFFCFLAQRKEHTVLGLSLVGVIFYVMLFEARARYLIIFMPLFILAAVLSLEAVISKLAAERVPSEQKSE